MAGRLWQRGYGFDFVSDRLLNACTAQAGNIHSPGARYRVVVVPAARVMPVKTLEKLLGLAGDGATVAFVAHLPEDVPGLHAVDTRLTRLRELRDDLKWGPTGRAGVREAVVGRGRLLVGQNVEKLLAVADVQRESIVDRGVQFIRRRHDLGHHYFMTNAGSQSVNGWVAPAVDFMAAALFDPMTGTTGFAETRHPAENQRQLRLQLDPGQSVIVRTFARPLEGPAWRYRELAGRPVEIRGTWSVEFISGGPALPGSFTTDSLDSWTKLGGAEAQRFAGTARYSVSFDAPPGGKTFLLDLGHVADSARVTLNDQPLATLVNHPFQVTVNSLRAKGNRLEIEVTNVAANRVRDLDFRHVPWKELHGYGMLNMGTQVNKAGLKRRTLDASLWPVRDAGLFGPVTLHALD